MVVHLTMSKQKDEEIVKLQSKVRRKLANHVKKQKDFKSMNSYIKSALIEKSKFTE